MVKNKANKNIYRYFAEVFFCLIFCLSAWFLTAKILNIPLVWLTDITLSFLSGGTFTDVEMYYSNTEGFKLINQQFILSTNIPPPGDFPVNAITNPLIYGYGLAVFAALTLATPKNEARKWKEIGIAYIIFLFIQLIGISIKALMQFIFYSPESIKAHFPLIASHTDILGISYQISTLVLPPVTPLILWIFFNTSFIEQLIGHKLPTKKSKTKIKK